MEQRFGHDFSRVRVHSDATAEQSARDVNAHAYTMGHNIVFGAGRLAPSTNQGRRLIAHELTHVVQQGAAASDLGHSYNSRAPAQVIQREVEHEGVESAAAVLGQVSSITTRYGSAAPSGGDFTDDEVAKASPVPSVAVANNLGRLKALSLKFNPGAPGKAGPTNKFVYSCHCGWLDMGHFFISALVAYMDAYAQQLELRRSGETVTHGQLVAKLFDRAAPVLAPLLDTVGEGGQGKDILARQRKLLESGDPRDISLAGGGFFTEYYQQLAKVVADRMTKVPQQLKDEQRSAFTIEDLPSDCYGAALGQDVWNRINHVRKSLDVSPIQELMSKVFTDCGAVHPTGQTLCDMMSETTPGSCRMENGNPVWSGSGTPRQNIKPTPRQLKSARPLCGDNPAVVPCKSGTGGAESPVPAAVLDMSETGATLTLTQNIPLHQPRERGVFGGEVSIPRPERIDRRPPLILSGPSFLRVTPTGHLIAHSSLGGLQDLGDIESTASLDPSLGRFGAHGALGLRGRFDVQADGPLQVHVHGKMDIDLEHLLEGLAGPELAQLKETLKSDAFTGLVKKLLRRDIGPKEFMREVKSLLKQQFPQGFEGLIDTVIFRLKNMEALAGATSLDAQGTVSVGGIPISGLLFHKSFGLLPVLGLEGGLVTSELIKGRLIVGAKGWLYGQKVLQAQLTAGIDPVGRKAIAELHAEHMTLKGNKLSLDLRYQLNPAGEQQFFVFFGGTFNKGDPK
jgi:hypothetical protein